MTDTTPMTKGPHHPMPDLPRPVLFGAAYYHEYQPAPRLEQDLDLMVEAGFPPPGLDGRDAVD